MGVCLVLYILWLPLTLGGQNNIKDILNSIVKNNKTIIANKQYWNAQNKLFETGLMPEDPKIEFDYLFGTPAEMGNQTDLNVVQSLDFPTVYKKKRNLAYVQKQQSGYAEKIVVQEILFEAKIICIDLIYRNKLKIEMDKRKESAIQWVWFYQKKLDTGEGNILDLNKAKLYLMSIELEEKENQGEIEDLTQKIIQLNGGIEIKFNDTAYENIDFIPDLETLKLEVEEINFQHKFLEQQKIIAQRQVEVTKALKWPKFELGYHYQSILNQKFNGVHLGMTIPLWENKNRVEAQQQLVILASDELNKAHQEYISEIEQLYNQYKNKKTLLSEYKIVLQSVNTHLALLDKALEYGQNTVLQYFQEIDYCYTSIKKLLKTEKEYQAVIAELMKYKLVGENETKNN